MENISIRIIHPTNNSDIEIGVVENMFLRDIFSQLIELNFVNEGQAYSGVLKPSGDRREAKPLDNEKTVSENGIDNNDTIQMIMSTQAG